jgi:hypothetical protein
MLATHSIHVLDSCRPCLNIHYEYLFNFQETYLKFMPWSLVLRGLVLEKIAWRNWTEHAQKELKRANRVTWPLARHCELHHSPLRVHLLAVASMVASNTPGRVFCSPRQAVCSPWRVMTVQTCIIGVFDPKTSIQNIPRHIMALEIIWNL